ARSAVSRLARRGSGEPHAVPALVRGQRTLLHDNRGHARHSDDDGAVVRIIFDALRDGLSSIQTADRQMAEAQHQLASGKRVAGAGDDPLAVQQAIGERAVMGAVDAYTRTSQSAASQLA